MLEGMVFYDELKDILVGSIDMGDVCYECFGFYGVFGIGMEEGLLNYIKGFMRVVVMEDVFVRVVECGKGMVLVGWKVLIDDVFVDEM